MKIKVKYYLFAAFISLSGAVHANDFEQGLEHMTNGDYAKAFCLWEPLARVGHADAQFNLAWLYANGNGLNVDISQAVYWWQQAANNGHLDAEFAIAMAYTTGEGIKHDLDKAFGWFLKAALAGHEDSQDVVKRLVLETDRDYYSKYPELSKADWLAQYVVVSADVANIRSGPGISNQIVLQAKKGKSFRRLAVKNDWLKIQLDDNPENIGWIYDKLIKQSKN